jgi:hypothetical protein
MYCTKETEFGGGGGDALFSGSHAQFEGLPTKLRAKACGLTAKNDFVSFRQRQRRLGVPGEKPCTRRVEIMH